jgi:hypothetical protein
VVEAVVPVAVAALEEEELGNKELHIPRFPNTPVGTFGWWGGTAALLVPTTSGA